MKNILRTAFVRDKGRGWPVILATAALLLIGCQAREAPLSPGAATFKQEMKSLFDNLAKTLEDPVANKDRAGITAALEKAESPAANLCRLCPFEMVVLNTSGETLAAYPVKGDGKAQNFSNYDVVKKASTSKKVQQQQFFLHDGSKVYIVCAPLIRENALIGLIVVAINAEDVKQRWDLKEKEFLALDFNK